MRLPRFRKVGICSPPPEMSMPEYEESVRSITRGNRVKEFINKLLDKIDSPKDVR